jgi:hypothetical protein
MGMVATSPTSSSNDGTAEMNRLAIANKGYRPLVQRCIIIVHVKAGITSSCI